MRIVMGSDHAGFELKNHLAEHLRSQGHEVIDVGAHSTESVDYPTYGAKAARTVANGEADRAILVCGTGQGIGMAANKVPGVRCAIVSDPYSAKLSREHNDANSLAIGARVIGAGVAEDIVDIWTTTEFLGGRHGRRVTMLAELDSVEPGE
ncbi:ribose 5-phosphate isomerase B [Actinomyces provencensis]|uniref:ribose 5-phosphate isomerase B n=1 Tax=Actinomyces provencensis TaxID=1720198 RepID=UPI00096A6995|nr:ribose 5-phosphate isomerase B [Actinomyces provencensis]